MKITCTKAEAATRQLDEAIMLLFANHDSLAIRTLAAAAHGILADLLEFNLPGSSWRTKVVEDSGLPEKQAYAVLNSAQNFLKHADRDPDAEFSFEDVENDHLIFLATLECGDVGHPLSFAMQTFQIWYFASYPALMTKGKDLVQDAKLALPDLGELDRKTRLARGAEFMRMLRSKKDELLLSNPPLQPPSGARGLGQSEK
jgi:hypothetical protein